MSLLEQTSPIAYDLNYLIALEVGGNFARDNIRSAADDLGSDFVTYLVK